MDTKGLIIKASIMLGIVSAYFLALNYIYKVHPSWRNSDQATTQPAPVPAPVSPAIVGGVPSTQSTTQPGGNVSPVVASGYHVIIVPGITLPAELGSLHHSDSRYALALDVDSAGAGLNGVTLNDFYDTAEQKNQYRFQTPLDALGSASDPLATRSIVINGVPIDMTSLPWQRVKSDTTSATYTTTIADGEAPALEVTKTYQLFPRDVADGSSGFEVHVNQSFRNLSRKPLNVRTTLNGPDMPPKESDRADDRIYVAGFDNGEQEVSLKEVGLPELKPTSPTKEILADEKRPLLWIGTGSAYFDAIVRPLSAGNAGIHFDSAVATGQNLSGPPDDQNATLQLQTSEFKVDPGVVVPFNLRVFFGPKKRSVLESPYYSSFPLAYNQILNYRSGPCGFLTFSWLIAVLNGILWFFEKITRDWGLAIICLVILVRTLLHPVTKKSQVNMMQMSKMGPEIERLKKKYGDNKDELNKAMMGVYKQQGMTPILGCLPMLLQMPIWIALWSALQNTFELRQAPFLRFGWLHLTWIKDLSRPDALVHFSRAVPLLFGLSIHGINVLPILLAVVFFIQQQVQPQPPNMTPEQEQQRKMMKWMSLLFPTFLYGGPSGLNLYILTSTTIGIIESKIIRDHIKQRDEAEKAGRVLVNVKPTRASKRRDDDRTIRSARDAKPTGGIRGWLADIQAKAEQVRRDAERRGEK